MILSVYQDIGQGRHNPLICQVKSFASARKRCRMEVERLGSHASGEVINSVGVYCEAYDPFGIKIYAMPTAMATNFDSVPPLSAAITDLLMSHWREHNSVKHLEKSLRPATRDGISYALLELEGLGLALPLKEPRCQKRWTTTAVCDFLWKHKLFTWQQNKSKRRVFV